MNCNSLKIKHIVLLISSIFHEIYAESDPNESSNEDADHIMNAIGENSIDNIVNAIGMLRDVKTDNVLALKNLLGEPYLRTKHLDKQNIIDALKRVANVLTDSRERNKVFIIDDDEPEHYLSNKILKNTKPVNFLRNNADTDTDEDKSESESIGHLKTSENIKSLKENSKNGGRDNYYYGNYDCEGGKKRCYKACKEAYRSACDYEYCKKSLRRRLRKYCKYECRRWFY